MLYDVIVDERLALIENKEMQMYQGYKNRNYWNVALWINNDEGLYRHAVNLCKTMTKDEAARQMLSELPPKTPDGATFSFSSIRAALSDLVDEK